jgi:hypothetical protein
MKDDNLSDLGAHRKITLEWVLKEPDVRMWTN